jgi:uncharacterized protein involved in exopolysaccharide biosynthesis
MCVLYARRAAGGAILRMTTSEPPVLSEANLADVLRRQWLVVLTPVVVLVAVASVLAFGRTPVYKAQARMTIGSLNISTQGIPGFVYAAQGLSAAYARVVTADGVVNPVAAQMKLPVHDVINDLSGSPTPNSPIFLIEGKGKSAAKAIQITNLAAKQLQTYIARFNSISTGQNQALATYKQSSLTTNTLKLQRDTAQKAAFAHPSAANRKKYLQLASDYDVAKGKQLAALGNFAGAASGNSGANLVQVIAPANKATSDRGSIAKILLLVGVVAGLVIGLALGVARNYGQRRAG